MKEILKMLRSFGYKVSYQSYHKSLEIKQYKYKKDWINPQKFLTIFTPAGHVVGRLYDQTKDLTTLKQEELDYLKGFFTMFQIPNAKKILANLNKITL